MVDYELKWFDAEYDSDGKLKYTAGYRHTPVKLGDSESYQKFLSEVMSYHDSEYDRRLAKAAVNWFDPIKAYMHDNGIKGSPQAFIDATKVHDLAVLVEFTDIIDFSTAKHKVFPELINNFGEERTWDVIERLGLLERTESSELEIVIDEILELNQAEVEKHKSGKKNMTGFFMGQIMKSGKVKVNPKELNEIIRKKLEA